MALLGNLVQDTFTTTGTGTVTLTNAVPAGAQAGSTTFATQFTYGGAVSYPVNNVFYYASDASGNFELGVGNLLSATSLQRVNVLYSSNAGNLVNWVAGTKNIYSNPNLILSSQGSWQRTLFSALPENDVVSGSFTGTVNSGSTATTGTIYYKVDNAGRVTLTIPAAITGTAAGTTLTLTGIPAFLSNVTTKAVPCFVTGTSTGGVVVPGSGSIAGGAGPTSTGTLTLSQYTSLTTGFSATFTTAVVTGLPAQDITWNLM